MKKKMMGLVIGFLLIGVNVFAAGDLFVTGNLAVGTASPLYKLDVRTPGIFGTQLHFSSTDADSGGYIGAAGNTNNVYLAGGATYDNATLTWIAKSSASGAFRVGGPGDLIFESTNNLTSGTSFTPSIRMRILAASGYVGIGTSSPAFPLHMASGAYVSAGGVWTNASSREYKDNVAELSTSQALAAVRELNPVTFTYKVDAADKHVGFIAEDVPELVATKDRKGLSAMDIVAVLTKVVQEQQKEIEKLKSDMTKMKAKDMVSGVFSR